MRRCWRVQSTSALLKDSLLQLCSLSAKLKIREDPKILKFHKMYVSTYTMVRKLREQHGVGQKRGNERQTRGEKTSEWVVPGYCKEPYALYALRVVNSAELPRFLRREGPTSRGSKAGGDAARYMPKTH